MEMLSDVGSTPTISTILWKKEPLRVLFFVKGQRDGGSRTQSGRERKGRQSCGLPGSERSEAGREGRRGGSTQAQGAAGGRLPPSPPFKPLKSLGFKGYCMQFFIFARISEDHLYLVYK